MKKFISILILTFLLLPQSVTLADGMLVPLTTILGQFDLYETSQTALIVYEKGKENLYIKINYEGEADDFAWIIPTPNLPEPVEAVDDIFDELYEISKPEIKYEGNRGLFDGMSWGSLGNEGVEVHSQGVVGVYDFAVLSATGGNSLLSWLETNDYNIPQEARELIDWYLEKDWYFTVIKINKKEFYERVYKDKKDNRYYSYFDIKEHMHPIKLSFLSDSIVYPIKISQYSTLSPEKYAKMITDKYPEYKTSGISDIEIITKWIDDAREEIIQKIKDNIVYNEELKFNNTIVTRTMVDQQGKEEVFFSKIHESNYDKYKNRWWKKNNTQKWFENVVKEIADEDDRAALLKLKECGVFKGLEFSDENIVEDFHVQLMEDFEKVMTDKTWSRVGLPYINKIYQARSSCGPIDGVDTKPYNAIMHELRQDFPYYTEDGIRHDIETITHGALSDELKQILWSNGKTNEVLIYIVTDQKVKGPNFKLEYADWLSSESLKEHDELKKIISSDMYITKLRRHFAKKEMDDDVYFVYDSDNSSFRHTIIDKGSTIDYGYDFKVEEVPLSISYSDSNYQALVAQAKEKNKISLVEKINWMIVGFIAMSGTLVAVIITFIFIKKRRKENTEEQEVITDDNQALDD